MDIEEVKKFLTNDANGKKLLDELAEKHASIDGLKAKNAELIEANRRFKESAEASKAEAEAANAKVDELKNIDVETAVANATSQLKADYEKVSKALELKEKEVRDSKIETTLNDAINSAGIASQHQKAVKALLRSENVIDIDEVDQNVKVGGKPLSDFVTEWSRGESGKYYVKATENNGGGAQGSQSAGGSSNIDISKMRPGASQLEAARNLGK